LSNVDIPPTDAILVRPEAASMRPGGRWPAGSGGSGSGRSPEARPDSTTRSGNEVHRSPILNRSQLIDCKGCIITAYNQQRSWAMSQMECHTNNDLRINVSAKTLARALTRDPDVDGCWDTYG
jgi:hypothetical protein